MIKDGSAGERLFKFRPKVLIQNVRRQSYEVIEAERGSQEKKADEECPVLIRHP